MNPYLNSLNGFGGGFIAFWPSQGGVKGGSASGRLKQSTKKLPKELLELTPIGEIVNGEEVLYSEINIPQILKDIETIKESLKKLSKEESELKELPDKINRELTFLRIIKKIDEGNKLRIVIVNTLDMFLEEEAILLILLSNNS